MSKKLTAHMMSKLVEGIKRIDETGSDTELYISVVSEKDALVKADNDFSLGLAVGMALGTEPSLVDGLEFKFLSNVTHGKLYELSLDYPKEIEETVEFELGLSES
jgi:hypothetical protein